MKPASNLFEFLDWVLKKRGKEPIDENTITPFIFNRWISMSSPDNARIVNVTQNRWCNGETREFLPIAKFYNKILPKNTARLSYIKKVSIKSEIEDDSVNICQNLEISQREKDLFDKTLAELKL